MTWWRIGRSIVVALGGAACLAVATLWPISRVRPVTVVAYGPGGRAAALALAGGTVHVLVADVPTGPLVAWSVDVRHWDADGFANLRDQLVTAAAVHLGDRVGPKAVTHAPLGLSAGGGRDVFGTTGTWFAYASAPAWAVAPALAVLPAVAVRRAWKRRRRTRAGACPACGYDLRASPGRCPECGRPAAITPR